MASKASRSLVGALVCGVLVSFATGLVSRNVVGIPETRHYGYPLIWRVTNLNGPTEYVPFNLAVDAAFWVTLSLIASVLMEKVLAPRLGRAFDYRGLLLPSALFIPLGLVMDLVHELGHAIWGTAVGGRLTYMQIAYLQIFPRLAVTPHFQLGLARVEGLPYGSFAYGFMLLGGSMTTSIASWLLALILLKISLGRRTRVALRVLGLFGLLDLPFYVVFPQLGLGHWIFFGGGGPEPLTGARMMGVPDPLFYLSVTLSTVGLAFLHFKPLLERGWKEAKTVVATLKTGKLKPVCGAVICGVLVSLATGAVKNPPKASIIGATHYGHPLPWRVTLTTIDGATHLRPANLVLDALFWTVILFFAWTAVQKISRRSTEVPKVRSG